MHDSVMHRDQNLRKTMTDETFANAMKAKVEYIRNHPEVARALFKARTRWESGTRCTAQVRNFPPMVIDEPPDLGGTDAGVNPVELLLVSLGTCQEIVYSLYAQMMGIELESVTCDVKGQLDVRGIFNIDPAIPAGYQKITFETRLQTQASHESLHKLIRTVEACCPTLDTLKRPVDVAGSVFVNGESFTPA